MKTRVRYGKKQKKQGARKSILPGQSTHAESTTTTQQLLSTTACPEEFQWQQVSDLQKFAARLLDQQLWCFGKDILHPEGNLLLKYGFEKQSPPANLDAVSLYQLQTSPDSQLILRGFGLFFGDNRWGGIFVRRCEFTPLYNPVAILNTPPWTPQDLPLFQSAETADPTASLQLVRALITQICDYERWIEQECGVDYRNASLQRWEEKNKQVVRGSDMLTAWKELAAHWAIVEQQTV